MKVNKKGNNKERQASTMDELIEMIIVYAEHIYDETHAKGVGELNGEKAIGDDHYFDDLIYYGEKYLEFVKAAQALARAKQVLAEGELKEEPKEEPKYDYAVVVYGGFDETPLIRYQREYDDKDQATTVYHELEDMFRLEHKIFDNNTEEFIAQEDCSSMAVIKCGPHDDEEVISFKSLLDKTNAPYLNEDYRQIVNYLIENCKL